MTNLKKSTILLVMCLILALSPLTNAYALSEKNKDDIITYSLQVHKYGETIAQLEKELTKDIESESDVTTKSAITLTDISNHWAKDKIQEAVKLGFVGGYPDNTFKPNNTITRAEFATLINKAIDIKNKTEINLVDVSKRDWYYDEVNKAISAGIFSGYNDNTFKPQNPITRQEVAKVISSVITTADTDGVGASQMSDYANIHDWAKPSVDLSANKGYLKGYPDGTFMPTKSLTRAEAVKIIIDILDNENMERDFKVTNDGEIYHSAVVIGTLTITDSVGSGSVNLRNVTVVGDIIVKGADITNIYMSDVKAKSITIENDDCSVTLNLDDNVNIENANLTKSTTLQKTGTNINIKNTIFR